MLREDELPDALLVRGAHVGPEQRNRDRVAAHVDELARHASYFIVAQRDDDRALVVHALVDAADELARDDPGDRLVVEQKVVDLILVEAGDLLLDPAHEERVLVPARGDEPGDRAGVREERVRRDRRAVAEARRPREELLGAHAQLLRGARDAVHHTDREVPWRRRACARGDGALIGADDAVGEGAAGVDADPITAQGTATSTSWRIGSSFRQTSVSRRRRHPGQ